jgi:cell division protein FtsL
MSAAQNDQTQLTQLERRTKTLSISLFLVSLMVVALAVVYSFPDLFEKEEMLVYNEEVLGLKQQIEELNAENQELRKIEEFYLAKRLLENDTIYSVQTGMIPMDSTSFISQGLSNGMFIEAIPYLKYSIGLYETYEEANALRRGLVKLGFTDAFIASYKGTTRLQIHRPQ